MSDKKLTIKHKIGLYFNTFFHEKTLPNKEFSTKSLLEMGKTINYWYGTYTNLDSYIRIFKDMRLKNQFKDYGLYLDEIQTRPYYKFKMRKIK
jgi:hypothetical protein